MPQSKIRDLTPKWVRQAKEPGSYTDGYGLTLRIDARGNKRWFQRLTYRGKQRNLGLGSYPEISLDEARELALANWRSAKAGLDPIAERNVMGAGPIPTFEDVARKAIALHRPRWSNAKHAAQWERTLETYVFPTIGRVTVDAVSTSDVLRVLEPIWNSKPETAARVRQRIEVICDYAIASGWRMDNPALAVKKVLPRGRGTKRHHPAMPYGRLPSFIRELRAASADAITKLALELLILTAARSGEVHHMEWSEVDTKSATWTVPASRMKARKEHRVPLSRRAFALLDEVRSLGKGTGLVFPSRMGRHLSNMSFTMLLRRLDTDGAVPHGFRSTFKDWTLEQTSFPWAVAEAALAHTLGSATEVAYARSDLFERRRELMETWAMHCESSDQPTKAKAVSLVPKAWDPTKHPVGERLLGALRAASGIGDRA